MGDELRLTAPQSTKLLVMWCSEGLEFVYDLGDWERRRVWASLKGETTEDPPNLRHLILRAQVNAQRNYEIYIVETVDISREMVEEYFSHSPQSIVDLIRERGHQLYSDRATKKAVIV